MRWASTALLLMCACSGRHGDENFGLSSGGAGSVDVARLTQPDELVRALSLTGRELDGKLGAHRMDATETLKLELGDRQTVSLDETFAVEADGRGGVHLAHDNSRGNGFEAVALNDDLYVKPRYGKFVRRKIESDELERLRATAETAAASDLRLINRFVQVREAGTATVAGHAGVKLTLAARSTPDGAPAMETEPGRKWRESVNVRYIDGDVVLDAKSGAPLAVRLEAQYTFARDGKPVQATLAYKQTTAPETVAVAAPADWTTLSRPRPMLDRQQLLEGLK
ncbi:MAG TPA: hypothetical protein VHB97_23350 [Polyangia bacterium]|nr:hypothetical protein [Polyangia bacterium]